MLPVVGTQNIIEYSNYTKKLPRVLTSMTILILIKYLSSYWS